MLDLYVFIYLFISFIAFMLGFTVELYELEHKNTIGTVLFPAYYIGMLIVKVLSYEIK